MKNLSKLITSMLLFLLPSLVQAQQQSVEMADNMRAEGKIYVLLAIILTVLGGFIAYLFLLDRKLGKMEKQIGLKS